MDTSLFWTIATALGLVGVVTVGLGLRSLQSKIRTVDKGFQSPLLQFFYTADAAAALRERLQNHGLETLHKRFCALMVCMMVQVLLVLLVVTHNIRHIAWLTTGMFAVSVLIWLFGTLEALTLCKQPKAARLCSLGKWGAFALWTLAMFVSLFVRSMRL